MQPIPVRVRERIIALYDQGESTAGIAELFGYCPAAVRRVRQYLRDRGTLEPLAHGGGRPGGLTGEQAAAVRAAVAAAPDATLAELRDAAAPAVSVSTVDRWLGQLGLPRKKSRGGPRSGTGRT